MDVVAVSVPAPEVSSTLFWRAWLWLKVSTPALTRVSPLKVLALVSAQVPKPVFVRVPVPVAITLARLLAGPLPPRVKLKPAPVMVPLFESTMFPLPAMMLLELPNVIRPL